MTIDKHESIYVAGHKGFAGAEIVRVLKRAGYRNIIGKSSSELDLLRDEDVVSFFAFHKPRYVIHAAGRVGGINANQRNPVQYLSDNVRMAINVISSAHRYGCDKLLYLGSACCYPRDCPQPMHEHDLFSGPLEPTNSAYAMAKLTGIELCRAYRHQYGANYVACLPANLYGPDDNYSVHTSHAVAALIRKVHTAKERGEKYLRVWGTGTARREFLHVYDLAEACLFLLESDICGHLLVNIGSGEEYSIAELARMICDAFEWDAELVFDESKPDGAPRRVLSSEVIQRLGWTPICRLKNLLSAICALYAGRNERTGKLDMVI